MPVSTDSKLLAKPLRRARTQSGTRLKAQQQGAFARAGLPVVAVVGRPNVGKSTLVNRLVGNRAAIVDDQPGVTRDRSYHEAIWNGQRFSLIDTGGLTGDNEDPFGPLIEAQVGLALEEADLILLVLDGQTGLTADDERVVKLLRKHLKGGSKKEAAKPLLLAVNKIDRVQDVAQAAEFYSLGLGEPRPVSALQGNTSVGDLLDELVRLLPEKPRGGADSETLPLRLTLVGRPNVGKSSLVNSLLGTQRSIVSDISGTTRDAIDTPLEWGDKRYILVDTAGIRRKTKVDFGVELFSVDRAVRAMRRSDVVVLVLDAVDGLTEQDKRIAQKAMDAGRGLLVVVNKWDLIDDKTPNSVKTHKAKLLEGMPNLAFAEFLYTSAMSGQRVPRILELSDRVQQNRMRRLSTSVLNQVLQEAVTISPPPITKNKRFKLLYATQVKAGPPTLVLFVNDVKLLSEAYKRYLERKLRENVELSGTPVVLLFRDREDQVTSGKRSPSKNALGKMSHKKVAAQEETKARYAKTQDLNKQEVKGQAVKPASKSRARRKP